MVDGPINRHIVFEDSQFAERHFDFEPVEAEMPIRGRVGRHTRAQGRHCQNWPDDQKTVVALLNKIDFDAGGAEGSLDTQVVNGVCSAKLYSAISRFEDKYFPGQRSGFVDPRGKMLQRMEKLSTGGPKVIIESVKSVPKNYLADLHACLLDDSEVRGKWTAGEQVQVDGLVNMAINHLDRLMGMDLDDLPWPAELFGRAYVTRYDPMAMWSNYGREITSLVKSRSLRFANPDFDTKDPSAKGYEMDAQGVEAPPLSEMKYGNPVSLDYWITTAHLPAVLLFKQGWCRRIRSYSSGTINRANNFGYRGITPADPLDRIVGYPDD